jgi:hypothetical protein
MHRSHPNSVNPTIRGALTLLAWPLLAWPLLAWPLLAAVAPAADAHARAAALDPATSSPARVVFAGWDAWSLVASQDTAKTPDQIFLRSMSDSHTGLALAVHMVMHRPGTFPSKADAQRVDRRIDDDLDRMGAALKGIFKDNYVPKARPTARVLTDSLATLTGANFDSTFRKFVVEYDRLELQTIDRAVPKMTNTQVKTLAQRMRASASTEMASLLAQKAGA